MERGATRVGLALGLSLAMMTSFAVAPAEAQRRMPPGAGAGASGDGGGGNASEKKSSIKPYDEIVTDEFTTKSGLFLVHTDGDNILYEIPSSALNYDMLWVTQVAGTQAGYSYAGMPAGDRVVRWEKRGDNILLRDVNYTIRADTDDPVAIAVEATSIAPIIKVFEIKAWGKDQAPVIDVTDLFTGDVSEFSAERTIGASGVDSKRTFVETVKAFPRNIETRVLTTFKPDRGGAQQGPGGPPRGQRRDPSQSGVTALVHHSMIKLPENPMKPRELDSRVGFFSVGFEDYADDSAHEVETKRYITRWRLEKKDPDAELSEPKQPIVWYIGRGVPEKWRPYFKAGVEQWQPAFEAAGFKNAIIAKEPPSEREDPDWDAEDARYTTIRWLPSNIPNAFGPHVNDPRTGEIIEADVRMYHNVMKLVRDWYFVQASPNDERAQQLPMPDDLMGELIQFVVAHEVGHSLGFPHNMKASSSYSIEQLRDPEWTKANGTAPSIMDYARFNYVAQPGDGAALMPGVGAYDKFATEWGYRQFAADADEKAELEAIVERQLENPMLLFGNPNPFEDPTQQTEDLGEDAVAATELGLANLKRVAGYLVDATCSEGEDYDLLDNMYGAVLGQWAREMGHVANVVGGVKLVNFYYGDADQRFFPIDADTQRGAVDFLLENALSTPDEAFIDMDILGRIEASGSPDRMLGQQSRVLRALMNENRLKRMAEIAAVNEDTYTAAELFSDVQNGLFAEMDAGRGRNAGNVSVDVYRRNIQRAYVDLLGSMVEAESSDSDSTALARLNLRKLQDRIGNTTWGDEVTAAHFSDLHARIADALDND